MADFTITEWFESTLWLTYPRSLCNRIGAKSLALASAKSKIKDEADANKVLSALREQIRYYSKIKKTGAHGSEWKMPMLSTWLNGERWTDEIPSHYELKQKQAKEFCTCGEVTVIRDQCLDCYNKQYGIEDWREKMIWDYYVKNKLGQQPDETREVWAARLKQRARLNFRAIG